MRRAAIALALIATGCAGPNSLTQGNTARYVTWEKVPLDKIEAVCTRLMSGKSPEGTNYRGCVWIEPGGRSCTIYAPDFKSPASHLLMSNLGHELKHCFDGQWHQ